ncbi:hypothetical protein ACIA8C_39300 [Nocardia sp. NPDC051321]|uniref:hypothetical protein n=1 Tax=Nocardia sp. NPDC051321 TaxID=3364323 RepID=UPI0037A8D7B8
MTHPTIGLLDRYQDYRVRRWQVRDERLAGMLPRWRTRARRRALVITVVASLFAMFATGVLSAFDLRWAPMVSLPAVLVFLPSWTMLRIASQGHDHAPAQTLDEWEIAQRNTARSVGLTITQALVIAPVFYLVYSGAIFPEANAFQTAYAGGIMALAALLAGGCSPAMILGWTRPDPDQES